jgi:predicted transcriptional regulator
MATTLKYNKADSPDSKILVATSDINRELICRLINAHRNIDTEGIKEHIEIDDNFLEESLDILKDANLINNQQIEIEGNIRRIFNITSTGKAVLNKLK